MGKSYDYIVAGAGCAGLSFLWHLTQSPLRNKRILLVDRQFQPAQEKLWSFWGGDPLPFRSIACKSWERMAVRFPGIDLFDLLEKNPYHTVRSEHYRTRILDRLQEFPNIELREGNIESMEDLDRGVQIRLDGTSLRASHLFQSIRVAPQDKEQPVTYPLRQHFGGWEIQTDLPVFDSETMTLMDFDIDQRGAFIFVYTLPFTAHRALIEYTVVSPTPWAPSAYDRAIANYIKRRYGCAYTVERREYGVIPMEERPRSRRYGKHITSMGTAGGLTKPTTGYTFQRIQQHSQDLVDALVRGRLPEERQATPPRFRFYDVLLLHILYHTPEKGRPIFRRLFQHNPFDRILSFISEDTHPGQDALIFSRLPYAPFLRAIPPTVSLYSRLLWPKNAANERMTNSSSAPVLHSS